MTGDAVAASIAHELRQPLTAMVTTADAGFRFLDRPLPNLDRAKEAFERIAADGHRAGDLIGTIRANFKSEVRERTSFQLGELIDEALALARSDLQKHGILVHTEPGRQLPEVRGNRVQLQQVLLNLIVNAIDAMAANEPRVQASGPGVRRRPVVVSVADTGTNRVAGRRPDLQPAVHHRSDGMGMGLSICRAIVEGRGRL
jgi:C4-dicarboxylate-specific signal transduction histidine kinase